MKKLINPEYNLESKEAKELNSTVGINIYDGWTFPTKEDESISFSCNLWDFGGQEIQYMTHQFFLTPSALYVLVADDRKQHANFPYWFETIHLLGKEDNYQSPILVVLNENKHKSITNFDHHFYIKRYPHTQIQQNEVDLSKTGSRYYALREKVQQILCKLKHIGDEVPKQWKPIRDELKEIAKTQNHISEKDFFAICAKHKVAKEEDQLLISKYLHKLGSILHFQNDNYLRDFIILNPQWAVDAVYGVLENNTIAKNGGRFNKIQLDSIWKKYDRDEKFKLLNLMKKEAFEICYEVEEDEFIAAQLLGKIQPRYKWENEEALKFRYRYQFMPKGIITRFIVRCNKYIAYTESQKPLVWDKGIIIENSGCKALIIEDISNKEGLNVIDIEVIGEVNEKKFILRTIRKEIEAIHKKWFKNVKCEPMVPCICNDCKASETPTFFEYNELIKYRNQGEREIKCSNNRIKPVNVMELLEGIYLREELLREENMINEYHNKLSQHIDFKPTTSIKLTVDTEAKAGAKATAKAKATNTIAIEIQNILAETEMLKEDIEDERKLLQKEMDSDEIDVTVRDVEKAEKAMQEIEAAKKDNQEPATKSKNRLKRFIDDLSDEKSSIHKALKLLRKGRDYGVRLAETYNKIAENIGMPLAPPLALDVIKKL
jgi:GTPase SAR1 family protein